MTPRGDLGRQHAAQLAKALTRLERSFRKVESLPVDPSALSDDALETWESFVARFSRATDLFLARYLRGRVLAGDPGFRGTLRDFVDQGEKLGVVDDAEAWMRIRELRNLVSHEYVEQQLDRLFESCRSEAPRVLALRARLGLEP